MKTFCALATLAAATAVENTAPVISLSLTGVSPGSHGDAHGLDSEDHDLCDAALSARNSDAATASHCVEYDAHVAEAINGHSSGVEAAHPKYKNSHPHSFAAKALVTTDAAEFPEPTASAYDHHDESHVEIIKTYQYFVVSRPACNTFNGATETLTTPTSFTTADNVLSAGTVVNTGTYIAGNPTHPSTYTTPQWENQCAMAQTASDVNLVTDSPGEADADLDDSKQSHFSQQMRNRRGEFIIKYDATDRAGNQASQLVFAMILTDDHCPCPEGVGLKTVEAMDSCAAILPYKEGGLKGDTYAPTATYECDDLTRNQIMLDEKKIYWIDNYDGTSPTMASAEPAMRLHGLGYKITQNTYKVESSTTTMLQPIYDMAVSTAVDDTGTTVVEYRTKDYANIFGKDYADNQCTTGSKPAHCSAKPDTEWTIVDTLPPRIFPNPNLGAVEGGIRLGLANTKAGCGDAIGSTIAPAFTSGSGRTACHSWNLRRRWCNSVLPDNGINLSAEDYEIRDRCVGWSDTELFRERTDLASVGANACTYEIGEHNRDIGFAFDGTHHDTTKGSYKAYTDGGPEDDDHDVNAHHECGTDYREPGYQCIDVRDSYSATSTGSYPLTITGVNDALTVCNDYHVNTDICSMHQGIDYSQGANITSTGANTDARTGRLLSGKVDSADAYPLYGKDGECYSSLVATYKCTDAVGLSSDTILRKVTITDTVAPTLEIATAGMNLVNAQVGVGYSATYGLDCNGKNDVACTGFHNNFTDFTNMNHNGGGATIGRTDIEHFGAQTEHQAYIDGAASSETDWHETHEGADSQKGMNSHYHDESHSSFNKAITDGTSATLNYGGKHWKVDAGVVTLRDHSTGIVTAVGTAQGVQDSYVIQHSSGFDADEAVITNLVKAHKGFACYDMCDGDLTHAMTDGSTASTMANPLASSATNGVTMKWHHSDCDGAEIAGFNTLIPGTYALKYVCTDECGNSASKCRTILNEDHTKPVLTVLEADDQTYEATREDNYVDAGATCSDEVDGNISQDVEVSGDVVNLARVGVYTIKYNCEDSASNPADEATRKVTVQDTSCPTCVLSVDGTRTTVGSHTTSIEASFPYSDVGAVAQDTLQGSFGICSVWSQGTMEASYKNIVNVEATGTYYITYRVKDSNGNWNDDNKCSEGQTGDNLGDNIRTVVIIDTLRPVIELRYKGSANDAEQVIHRGAQEFTDGRGGAPRGDGDVAGRAADFLHQGAVHQADLHNRQVAGDHSVQRTTTTENHYTYTPSLMAEESATTAVNGWVIGAVASAVSGLALLGYSLRKSAAPVATSVPV